MKRLLGVVSIVLSTLVPVEAESAPSFYLPGKVYAAPGVECNVYYKNIINSSVPQNYSYQVAAKVGKARLTRWHWTPKESDAGTTNNLIVTAWNDDGVVACLTTQVVVAALPVNRQKKISFALFADSLTNSGYPRFIYDDLTQAGCTNFVPVGSRRPKSDFKGLWIPHDGIPGYTCSQFLCCCHVTEDEFKSAVGTPEYELYKRLGKPVKVGDDFDRCWVRSPLIREVNGLPVFNEKGKPVVDVQMWLDRVNGGRPVDVVMVQLGVNDVIWLKGDELSLRAEIRRGVMPWYKKFLMSLQAVMPHAHYVFTTQPLGSDQDAFGENYGADFNEVQHRKVMFALNKEIERFVAEQSDDRVSLLSAAQAIDPFYGFHTWSHPVNSREKTCKPRATNAVHLSTSGGAQLADTMAAWLLVNWDRL